MRKSAEMTVQKSVQNRAEFRAGTDFGRFSGKNRAKNARFERISGRNEGNSGSECGVPERGCFGTLITDCKYYAPSEDLARKKGDPKAAPWPCLHSRPVH